MILKAGNKNWEKSASSGSCHLSTYLTAIYVFRMLENEVISLTWKDKYCRFHLCEVPGAVRYTDRNWDVGCLGLGRIGE